MKQVSLFILLLTSFLINCAPANDIVASASVVSGKTGTEATVNLVLTSNKSITTAMSVVFSQETTTPLATDPTLTVSQTDQLVYKHTFTEPGSYTVFLSESGTTAQAATFTITGPVSNAITGIKGTPKATVEIELEFTITPTKIEASDEIVFTKAATPTVATDPKYKVTTAPTASESSLKGKLTFPTAGAYNLYVSNAGGLTKQGTLKIDVSSSGFISISFALLLALFLI